MKNNKQQRQLILLFSHKLTLQQEADAINSLGVSDIVSQPEYLQELWSNIPAEITSLKKHLKPVKDWIKNSVSENDHILIQGDFGATYLMVQFSFEHNLIPVYATSQRKAVETVQDDGSVKMEHIFKFIRFRRYGE